MTDALLTAAFVLIIVPSVWLLAGMLRTDWDAPDNPGGKAMVALLAVIVGSALIPLLVLLVPSWARDPAGEWLRIGARLAFAAVMWNMLRLRLRTQHQSGRRRKRQP